MLEWVNGALAWIDGLGWIGPVVFIAIYIGATVLLIPGSGDDHGDDHGL